LLALRLRDGKVRWRVDYQKDLLAPNPTWGFCSSPLLHDGKVIWRIPIENPSGHVVPVPAVIGDRLLLVDGSTGARLHRFNEKGIPSRKPVARNEEITSDISSPFVRKDLVLIGNGALTCADGESLKTLWTEADEESFQAPILHIVSRDHRTYVFSGDGHALVIEADRRGCKVLAKAKLSDATYARPAMDGDRLYARDESFLYCYTLKSPW
jgi:outer membrane protein assembly factor BamB